MVARRVYPTSDIGGKIAGFGAPLWSVVAKSETVDDGAEIPVSEQPKDGNGITLPTLKKGDKGEVVRAAQILLRGRDCSVGIWGADGDFGNMTRSAVLTFQRRNGLDADGIIGIKTWKALLGVN